MNECLTPSMLPLAEGVTVSETQVDAAFALVQDYCGWGLIQQTRTVALDSDGTPIVVLPSLLVTDVEALSYRTRPDLPLVADVDWSWSENGIIERIGGRWPAMRRSLTVTFTGGYEQLPPAIIAVVSSVATRMTDSGLVRQRSETTGGITVSESMPGSDGPGLKPLEAAALDRYRIGNAR